jgi:hypothetical protein
MTYSLQLYTVFFEKSDGSEECRIISAESREDAIDTIECLYGGDVIITCVF